VILGLRRGITRVVFCPNQIAATLALGMARSLVSPYRLVVVFWPGRCDVSALQAQGVLCHVYSRAACLKILLRHWLSTKIECVLPHRRLGRVVNSFAAVCPSLAMVDDGLDTLRDTPRNVDPAEFPAGTAFYTFSYPGALGRWLSRFEVRRVASLSMLAETSRPQIELCGVRRLVVESPPLDGMQAELDLAKPGTLVVLHSNVNKRTLKWPGMRTVNGADTNIEGSLSKFEGEVVTGETMVAVYALSVAQRAFSLEIHLTVAQAANLEPLIAMVKANQPDARVVVRP
jgi:hypothetical protein